MKILKTMLNPLRPTLMLLLLIPFSTVFAQNTDQKMNLDKIVETSFHVKNFNMWKPLFLKDSLQRKQNGMNTIIISSKVGQPNHMMNVATVMDVEKAKAAMKDPAYLERIKMRGVTNPKAEFYQVIRHNPDAKESKWAIMTHKVKDFDAWLVGFDQGKPMRENAGLIDALVARNIDNPMTVQVVCDITDMAKAKAFMNSPVLKEKMKEAGVISKPTIEYYESRE
ncbi:hypothetical protein QGN23_00725 [Chryseobacterium gotjawalense]|uniref:DUF4412 domain-containing protein n=1 Tax=Chryseobacterium gotjawalense TaxID=3042315 RepID=A0ABY8RFL2_9FLAO|nr:hypothetical protein [Chryseobacterium sp. wdc7]WHF51817.1 hypothetical protein QGN23_00725 [Chryseobacterium sp. wdc7]